MTKSAFPLSALAGFALACLPTTILQARDTPQPDAAAPEPAHPSRPAEQVAIETGLAPKIRFTGEPAPRFTIAERMESHGVTAASVAVLRDGRIHWQAYYGEGGGPDTLFQAASMSKAVAAVGIVALARQRGFSLDADIMPDLADVLDPRAVNPAGVKVTLRGLLSHTNGASVSGFPGYEHGTSIPSTLGVVLGAGGSNTGPVIIDPAKIGTLHYSGGGYTLAQLWAEHVSGKAFGPLMQELVLDPAGMTHSAFAIDPPSANVARATDGFDGPVPGGWNRYPEAAAAGLWTTPADYGRFAHGLMRAAQGDGASGIDPAVAQEVLRVIDDDYGLGIAVLDDTGSGQLRFSHSGGNRGYRTQFNAHPGPDEVIIVLTNAPGGWNLLGEIMRASRAAYGWPGDQGEEKTRFAMQPEALASLAGAYVPEGESEVAVRFTVNGNELEGQTRNGYRFRMVPIGPDSFIDPDDGGTINLRVQGDRVMMESNGQKFTRQND